MNVTPEWISAFVAVGWLGLALLAFFASLPIIFRLSKEKSFSVSVAGLQVSVQNATEQLADQLTDLQNRLLALENSLEERSQDGTSKAAPAETIKRTEVKVPRARRILWVDDFPSNNAFAVQKLRNDGFEVVLNESTAEGFKTFRGSEFGLVISDMGRQEKHGDNPTAGLDLLRLIRGVDQQTPFLVFASRRAVSKHRDEAIGLGAVDVTASAVTLFEHIAEVFGDDHVSL